MHRYANYRAQIKRMSEGSPVPDLEEGSGEPVLSSPSVSVASSFSPMGEMISDGMSKKPHGPNPYKDYLRSRHKIYWIQFAVLLLLLLGFGIWLATLILRS